MLSWLVALGFMAIATGPAFRWLSKNKEPLGTGGPFESPYGVIVWTLAAFFLVSYWNYSRGEKLRQACASFQEKIGSQASTDKQFEHVYDGKWWSICHPDTSDDQSSDN